jgi:methylthioribose-1-phosphate isomerase
LSDLPPDPTRRQFFRRFAGDVIVNASRMTAVVAELRDRSASEASALLGDEPAGASGVAAELPPAPSGFRTPFRFESDDVLLVIDQRRLPQELVEIPIRTAPEAARAIREMAVRGAPAIGQVAAIGLALTARQARSARPYARRAILHGAANTLRAARPTAVNLRWAVDRVMARFEALGGAPADADEVSAAMHDEAMAIVAEATDDHARLAEAGLAVLPDRHDGPVRVLTHCNTGPLACGQFGTALGVVQAAHAGSREIKVWVDETRPYLQGARLTAWELLQAGVPHTLIPDMAAGPLMARGEVDIILVGADRIAANGDTANKIGTYTLAVLAARHGVPFIVCAPLSSVDLATASGAGIPIEERPAEEVRAVRGIAIAPARTPIHNPAFDVTPAELIGAIVTEEGVLRPPFEISLRDAAEHRAARRDGPNPRDPDPAPAEPTTA